MQTTRIFSGVELAASILADLRSQPSDSLCVLADPVAPGAMAYADRISDYADRISLPITLRKYPETDDQRDALLSERKMAFVFLQPAPLTVDIADLLWRVGPDADAEGLHPINVGRHAKGEAALIPPTAEAAALVSMHLAGSLEGAVISVIGASPTVGRPLAMSLLSLGATVRVAQETTRDLAAETRDADIVIAAAGVPGLVDRRHLKKRAIAIDVGVTRVDGQLLGDIDRADVEGHVAWLTDVPDGVGPVTTACLLRNAINACRKLQR